MKKLGEWTKSLLWKEREVCKPLPLLRPEATKSESLTSVFWAELSLLRRLPEYNPTMQSSLFSLATNLAAFHQLNSKIRYTKYFPFSFSLFMFLPFIKIPFKQPIFMWCIYIFEQFQPKIHIKDLKPQ